MPESSIGLKTVEKLYKQLRQSTENFHELRPEILSTDPRKVLILRLMLKMSQNEFEKFLEWKSKNISKYESGKIRSMHLRTALKIVEKVGRIKPRSLTEINQELGRMKKDSGGWFKTHSNSSSVISGRRKGAIGSLQKRRTPQEKILEEMLKSKSIKFYVNYPLRENIIVDFYLPEKEIVIECKDIISHSKRENKEQVQKLAYQGYKTRFNFPEKRLLALVKCSLNANELKEELKGPFDEFFDDTQKLINAF